MRSLPWILVLTLFVPAFARAEEPVGTSSSAVSPAQGPAPAVEPPAELEAEPAADVPKAIAPKPDVAPAADGKAADSKAGASKTLARNLGEATSEERPYYVSGTVEFRMLAISDKDPANGRSMNYALRGGYSVFPGGTVLGALRLDQRFVAEPDESGFLLRDMQLAFQYAHAIELKTESLGSHTLSLTHRGSLYLPTSRKSQDNSLYLALEALHRGRIDLYDRLYLGLDLYYSYRFNHYAELGGVQGGMNRRFWFALAPALEYGVLESPTYGSLTVGVDVYTAYYMHEPSRDPTDTGSSDVTFWSQTYGWSAYLSYSPLAWLAATLSLEQNGDWRDAGYNRAHFLNRDESEIVFNVTARY